MFNSEDILQTILSISLIFAGLVFTNFLSNRIKIDNIRSNIIYIWHTFFAVLYYYYSLNRPADSKNYYFEGISSSYNFTLFGLGSEFVKNIIYIFNYLFEFSYFGYFILFSFFGAIGLILIDSVILKLTKHNKNILFNLSKYIVFIPSFSFWSCAIGKEPILMLGIGILIFSIYNISRKKYLVLMFSILLIFLVRPHIAFILFFSLMLSFFLFSNDLKFSKIIILFVSIIFFFLISPIVLKYINFMSINEILLLNFSEIINNYKQFIQERRLLNADSSSSIDINNFNLLKKVFYYLFMPLLFYEQNIFIVYVGIENTIILFFIIMFLFTTSNFKIYNFQNIFIICFFIASLIFMAETTSNLGIANRQKWTLLPFLFIFLISINKKYK
mgnify:FL=1